MFWLRPGDTWTREFPTCAQNGAAKDADSTPAVTLARNGTVDVAVTVTVTKLSTGLYSAACTIPGDYDPGDRVTLRLSATVDGVAAKTILAEERIIAIDMSTEFADQLYQDGGTNLINVNSDGSLNTNTVLDEDNLEALAGMINSRMGPNANQIAAALAQLLCDLRVSLIGPLLPGGAHRIVRGSACMYAKGRAPWIKVPKADFDLTGATAELRLKVDKQTLVTATGTILSLDENFWLVYADLPASKTDDLQPGTGIDQFWVMFSGDESCVSQHYLEVLEGLGVS